MKFLIPKSYETTTESSMIKANIACKIGRKGNKVAETIVQHKTCKDIIMQCLIQQDIS